MMRLYYEKTLGVKDSLSINDTHIAIPISKKISCGGVVNSFYSENSRCQLNTGGRLLQKVIF